MTLTVVSAVHATVQDLGRPGHAHLGVGAGGAADQHAARVANILVGNSERSPLIEITGGGFAAVTSTPLLIAVTGAARSVLVDGHPHPAWNPVVVPARSRVEILPPDAGWRSYLAARGRIEADRVMGSVAPDPLLGVGRRLVPEDEIRVDGPPPPDGDTPLGVPLFRFGLAAPARGRPLVVDVTRGPEHDEFDGTIAGRVFTVDARSDHVGLRVDGKTPARTRPHEILSRGVPVGAVEIPPAGGLLVLLRGRLLTAGYPVVAVATTTAVDDLAQCRPGDRITFREVTVAAAVAAARERAAHRAGLAARVTRALASR